MVQQQLAFVRLSGSELKKIARMKIHRKYNLDNQGHVMTFRRYRLLRPSFGQALELRVILEQLGNVTAGAVSSSKIFTRFDIGVDGLGERCVRELLKHHHRGNQSRTIGRYLRIQINWKFRINHRNFPNASR